MYQISLAFFLADDASEIGCSKSGIDRAHLRTDLAENRRLGGERQVTERRENVPAPNRVPANLRYDRLRNVADGGMYFVDGHAVDAAVAFVLTVMFGLVAPRAERLFSRTRQHDRSDILVVAGAGERLYEFDAGLTPKRIIDVGSIDCDRRDVVTYFEKQVLVFHEWGSSLVTFIRASSVRPRRSRSGR